MLKLHLENQDNQLKNIHIYLQIEYIHGRSYISYSEQYKKRETNIFFQKLSAVYLVSFLHMDFPQSSI